MAEVPDGYRRLDGSQRSPAPSATFLGPADAAEKVTVTIVLRRRLDGPQPPGHDFFSTTPPAQRRRLPTDDFADRYGAAPEDIARVTDFIRSHGLAVTETHAARRSVVASGTVAQMNEAFAVELGCYKHDVVRRPGEDPQAETYRGRDGFIHVPADLADIVIGVFGLDNRRVTKRNGADPPNTTTISVQDMIKLYNFPTNSAAGQTIAIFSEGGYRTSDLQAYYAPLSVPSITDVSVDASNDGTAD